MTPARDRNSAEARFERQQSLAIAGMEWDGRIDPLTPWSTLILRAAAILAVVGALAAVFL